MEANIETEQPSTSISSFTIDSSYIATVPAEEQAEELKLLGLSVYNQSTFEDGILEQVDKAFQQEEAEKEQRLAQLSLSSVLDDIRLVKVRLKQLEKAVGMIPKHLIETNKPAKRQVDAIYKEKENKMKQLKTLRAKQRGILTRLNMPVDNLGTEGESEEEGDLDPETKFQLDKILSLCQETEQEKLIRTGQMTPFGTMMSKSQLPKKIQLVPEMTDFEKYLLNQETLQNNKKTVSSKAKKFSGGESNSGINKRPRNECSDVHFAIPSTSKDIPPLLPPTKRKRRRKEDVGTITIATEADLKKIRRKPFWWPDPDANAVDLEEIEKGSKSSDSEYAPSNESTDDDEAESEIRSKIFGKRNKKKIKKNSNNSPGKRSKWKIVDDGNEKDYIKRIKIWKREQILKAIESEKEDDAVKDSETDVDKVENGDTENETVSKVHNEDGFEEFEEYRIPLKIWNKLYRYQQTCVRWLWELYCQRCGGVVGDEMGLGKTIQIIAYLVGLSHSSPDPKTRGLGPVIIVCPTTVMHQWVKEFHTWWPPFRVAILHESGSYTGTKESLVRNINKANGVLITSYSGIHLHSSSLLRYQWHYIILDEGHKIRNPDAQVTLACKQFRTPNRIILSGSPLQNNLKELWSLFDYVFPGKLGTLPVFMQQFAVPITHGGYANASKVQVETAYRCAVVLRETISPYLLRRMKADVNMVINLPKKNEQVLFCGLTEEQKELYKEYLNSKEVKSILDGRLQVFVGLTHLRKICNHADLYSGGPKIFGNQSVADLSEDMHYGYWKRSGKMIVVESVLKMWHQQKHRVLLFSQSKQMLDILERFVKIREYSYLRMDGTTSIRSRQPLVATFNQDASIFVFLLTTRVGGLGVNLTGANKVILFDPDWNPSTDMQARERAWRIGQLKDVTIYRLLTAGTIEEKIYHRQIFKQFLTNRVLKDPRQRRFFKSNQLFELFTLKDEDGKGATETSSIFAGTGSDVKLKPLKEAETKQSNKLSISQEKIEKMRELAKKLSQKLVENVEKSKTGGETNDSAEVAKATASRKSSPAKKKKSIGTKFEGRRHSYLMKTEFSRSKCDEEDESKRHAKQEEYVLQTLFTKAGVHGAMKHDKIIDASDPDYLLVEGEADRVAKEAVKALKVSQRQCYRAESGIPTWTGSHGQMAAEKPKSRFGKKNSINVNQNENLAQSKPTTNKAFNGASLFDEEPALSSGDLLKRMKMRNATVAESVDIDNDEATVTDLHPDNRFTTEYDELLVDIRNCVAFQCDVDGQATTAELLEKFQNRLPSKDSAVFKALLLRICDFHKDNLGDGIWRLKEEFR